LARVVLPLCALDTLTTPTNIITSRVTYKSPEHLWPFSQLWHNEVLLTAARIASLGMKERYTEASGIEVP